MVIDKTSEEAGKGYQILGAQINKPEFQDASVLIINKKNFLWDSLKFKLLCALGFVTRTFLMVFLFWEGTVWLIRVSGMSFKFGNWVVVATGILSCFSLSLVLLFRLLFKKTEKIHYAFWGIVSLIILLIYLLDKLGIFDSCSIFETCI